MINPILHRQRLWLETDVGVLTSTANLYHRYQKYFILFLFFLVLSANLHGFTMINPPEEGAKFEPRLKRHKESLSFPLFLYFQPGTRCVVAQNGGYLALHECPWHLTVCQWTLFTARAINL